MTTLRIARRAQFVRLDSRAVNDRQLSYRALGVLTWLLEKPDDWSVRAESIAAAKKEGRDAVRTALAELEAAGYLVRQKYRDPLGIWRSESVIYETPHAGDNPGENSVDGPVDNMANHDGKPGLVTRSGKPGPITTKKTQDDQLPPNPQQAGGRKPAAGSRANGTNPRAIAADEERKKAQWAFVDRVISLAYSLPAEFPAISAAVSAPAPDMRTLRDLVADEAHYHGATGNWAQVAEAVERQLAKTQAHAET